MELSTLPLFERLAPLERVLLSGAGGGFDVFAGLPLYFALRAQGKQVWLGNLSFSTLRTDQPGWLTDSVLEVSAQTEGSASYFPEKYLSAYFASHGQQVPVYAFKKRGVLPLLEAYRAVIARHDIQAVVLVDGGIDSLMRGDEPGLGTPTEDMASVGALDEIDELEERLLVCLGFGVDAFHGVCHHYFLEATAALTAKGAFLGAFTCMGQMPEVARYAEAVRFVHARMPRRPSIVNTSILTALDGEFGDAHRTARTQGSELYINPMMTMYFAFELAAVAARVGYLDLVKKTREIHEVTLAIEGWRSSIARQIRPRIDIPM